jgi:negative regulator of sigma E activity
MTKDIEKLSAWYDGEISQEDFDKGLENLGSSSESKKILHQYAILSELMQRKSKPQVSKLAQLIDYLPQKNPWISNVFTAAATVLITIMVLYQVDADRFGSDEASQMQLTSALSSQEAKDQLISADQNIMDHMIHIMQSNQQHEPNSIPKEMIPVGFMPSAKNPSRYTNGNNNLYFHIENKQLGINKVKYFKANNNWIYLIPLRDGRLLTAYGDVPPELASKMIRALN